MNTMNKLLIFFLVSILLGGSLMIIGQLFESPLIFYIGVGIMALPGTLLIILMFFGYCKSNFFGSPPDSSDNKYLSDRDNPNHPSYYSEW